MTLYIRALTIYQDVIFILLALGVIDICLPFLCHKVKYLPIRYISHTLPRDSYIVTPNGTEPNYTHYVKRRENSIPFVIYSVLFLLSCVTLGFIGFTCYKQDLFAYLFWGFLQLLISVAFWFKELKKFMSVQKHTEYLHLIETCQCCSNAFLVILLFTDKDNNYYTYIAQNSEHWKAGGVYSALCYGSYIDELNYTIVTDKNLVGIDKDSITSCRWWNNYGLPVTFVIIGVIMVVCFFILQYWSLLFIGAFMALIGILYIPKTHTKTLKVIDVHHTEVYSDLPKYTKWTFVLLGNNGRPYYYIVDDISSVSVETTYKCEVKGNHVTTILQEAEPLLKAKYIPSEFDKDFLVFHTICLLAVIGCEVSGWLIIGAVFSAIWVFLAVQIIRYYRKGDI